MRISAVLRYAVDPSQVYAMLVDPAFGERMCQANHALEHDVQVEEFDDGGATVTVHRVMPTEQVPEFVRSFVGPSVKVTEVREWHPAEPDGGRTGTLVVQIVGAPVRLTAALRLAAEGKGAVQTVDGDLKASIPLIGGKIEKAVEPAILAAIMVEERTATAWLADH
jgi:hypothetical protein